MKHIFIFFAALLFSLNLALPSHAQTGPQSIYIDCQSPSGSQDGLKRPRGDSNVWVFQIIPGGDVHWVEGPNWSYPGKGGSDPSWGQWSGGDGSLSLSWISPEHTGAFSINVTGKITCGSGGGGEPIDISALWSGDVLAKEWKAEPAITGGEFTQPADTDEDNPKEIGPGETVNLAVSEATDQDTWTQGEDSEQEADTVHYKWTSGDGGFVTDDHPDDDATEVTTQTAQWKAPEEPGNYTVTCEIDDEPAAVEDPDTGDRDDNPVTRTVHTKVVVGESSATLKLYKDAGLTEEATDTIGGTVYVVLEVKLGKYQKLASNNATLRIEENYDQHSEAERRWDQAVSFADGWKKKDANGEWQPTTETPQSKNTSGDDEYFRKVWSWPTYSQPLGHNEQHTVEIVKVDGGEDTELSFTPTSDGDDGKEGPESVDADVKNLLITDVSTNSGKPDYFKFDPDSDDTTYKTPELSFTIEDSGDPHQYKWTVKIRSTSVDDQEWTVFCRGQVPNAKKVSFKVNDPEAPNTQEGQLIYRGTYTFDISVEEYDDLNEENAQSLDSQTLRSPYLSIPPTYGEGKPGHNFYNEWVGSELHAKLDYYITDSKGKDANKVHVDFLDPEWEVKASSDLSTTINTPHENIDLYTYQSGMLSGDYKALVTAEDDHASQYRDHQNKYMPAVNAYKPAVSIEYITGQYEGANWYGIWVKRNLLGNSSKRQIRTDLLPNDNGNLPTVYEHVWDNVLRRAGWSPGLNAVLYPKVGTIWAATNGVFFNHQDDPSHALQGDMGINGTWQGSGVEYERWSVGIGESFSITRMTRSHDYGNFHSPSTITSAYSSDFGGVGALVVNGEKISPGYNVMEGSKKVNPSDPKGEYDELGKGAHTIITWSNDGRQCFILMVQEVLTPIGFTGWSWQESQNFVLDKLPQVIANYTKPSGKPSAQGLQITIGGAALLDGGSHSSLVYVREKKTKELTTNIPLNDSWNGWIAAITEISEYHSNAGLYNNPFGEDGGHRDNRTVLEAIALP